MTLNSRWYPTAVLNGDSEGKENFERSIRNSKTGLERLKEIIQSEVNSLEQPRGLDDYGEGWQFRQADRNGQLRVYNNILKLLEL